MGQGQYYHSVTRDVFLAPPVDGGRVNTGQYYLSVTRAVEIEGKGKAPLGVPKGG